MRQKKPLISLILCLMLGFLMLIVFGENGLVELMRMRSSQQELLKANHRLIQENLSMYRTVERMQKDVSFIENVARQELGMIRSDELIFKFKTEVKAK